MLKLAVPCAAFIATFSPMPLIAPPPEGRDTGGRLGPLDPVAKALPSLLLDLKSLLLGAVVLASACMAVGFGILGPATACMELFPPLGAGTLILVMITEGPSPLLFADCHRSVNELTIMN